MLVVAIIERASRHWWSRLPLVAALALAVTLAARQSAPSDQPTGQPLTAGQLLVASPELVDPNFTETVVYMVRHSPAGAMGFVLNRTIGEVPAKSLAEAFGIGPDLAAAADVRIHSGGPVAQRLGFVLHSRDYATDGTIVVDTDMALTGQADVGPDMFAAGAPRRRLILFGHAGWGPGQLDAELAAQAWIVVPADAAIVFDADLDTKWTRALARQELKL